LESIPGPHEHLKVRALYSNTGHIVIKMSQSNCVKTGHIVMKRSPPEKGEG
jgi:hypothetical protein